MNNNNNEQHSSILIELLAGDLSIAMAVFGYYIAMFAKKIWFICVKC